MEYAWFPISLLETLQSSVSYFDGVNFFLLEKTPSLSSPDGKLTAPRHENSQWLENIQVAHLGSTSPTVSYKSRKGNVIILTWCNVAQVLSLQLIIAIKATFFLLRKHVTAGGETTHGFCGDGLCLLQSNRQSQQDFPFRVSVLYGNTPVTCAELPCSEAQPATPTIRLWNTDTKHNSFLKMKMLSWLLTYSIQLTSASQPNPKLAVVQQP